MLLRMRIGVICSNPLVLSALDAFLRIEPDFLVVGTSCFCRSAEAMVTTQQADLVIVTEECVDEEGLAVIRRLRAEFGLKVMLLIEGHHAHRQLAEEFDTVQSSQTGPGSFLWRIRELVAVPATLDSEAAGALQPRERGGIGLFAKTARESEVARLVAQGYSNRRIAAMTGLTENTIKVYVGRLLRASGCENRAQLGIKLAALGQEVSSRPPLLDSE